MSVHLIGLTAMGGLPLFSRHVSMSRSNSSNLSPTESSEMESNIDNSNSNLSSNSSSNEISFARLAALNGVNLFSRLNDCDLLFCSTNTSQIRWKVYKGSVVLIIIVKNMSDMSQNHLLIFMDIVFDSLVLMCGLNDITSQNIERLKRCLRLSYQLIDYLLNSFISNTLLRIPLITNTIEYSINTYSEFMLSLVESAAQLASSSFCSIFINKKLITASKCWWTRLSSSKDALLITNLVNSMTDNDLMQTKEIAVYLPDNCPTSLTRLVVSQLSKGVVLCLLCAENPTLDLIESEIIVPLTDSKTHSEKFSKYLRNEIQMPFPVDENIIGFIIIRNDLKIFSTFGRLDDKLNYLMQLIDTQNSDNSESYLVNESAKCYHICKENLQIYVLFHFNIALVEMRSITYKTLNSLIKDKHIWP